MKVKTVSYRDPQAARGFADSLRETGFAVITDHPISGDLLARTLAEWEAFFSSPAKFDYLFQPEHQAGYFPFRTENAKDSSKKDLKEFYHHYPWRDLPATTRTHTPELYRLMIRLGGELLSWIERETPAEIRATFSMPLSDMVEASRENLLRTIHYPALTGAEEEGAVRAAAHEDINLITLLPAATAPGLQVRDMNGNWHEVPCDPGTLVINSGDMLKLASQGYYPSTTHRVMNPSGESARKPRFSMPLFMHAHKSVRLSPRHTAGSYLEERLREIGLLPGQRAAQVPGAATSPAS